MKPFFRELFLYNTHFNQRLIAVVAGNPAQVSGHSIKLMCHILNVHQTWNCKIDPGPLPSGAWDLHPLQELNVIDRKNFEHSNRIIDSYDLNQPIRYSTSKGQEFTNSTRDILFQVINHSTYHRAQIATEFRKCGLEPVLTDYIHYKMQGL